MSKLEFFVALALVALAQGKKGESTRVVISARIHACMSMYAHNCSDLSIEMVAALAQENNLPVPQLDLASLAPSVSAFGQPQSEIRAPVPTRAYSATDDPWSVQKFPSAPEVPNGSLVNGAPSSISGTGLPRDWWKKQETVTVNVLGQQGFILNRYLVYEVTTDVSMIMSLAVFLHSELFLQRAPPVPRRYSEFVVLWDCLVRRYPFRLLPALPPKRLGRKFTSCSRVFVGA